MSDDPRVPRTTTQTSQTPVSQTADLSTWLTKQQAADAIGVSTKAIERMAQEGSLQQARRRGTLGGAKLAVYHPADVAREATARQRGPLPAFLVPDPDTPTNGNGHAGANLHFPDATSALAPMQTGVDPDPLRLFATALVQAVLSQTSETATVSTTLYLTLDEAAAVSGLSRAFLRRMIANGTLTAIKDRGWKSRRKDLEAL